MAYSFLLLAITLTALVWLKEEAPDGNVRVSVKRNHIKGRILFEIQVSGLAEVERRAIPAP